MDEELEYPEWMIQYSEALKIVEKKRVLEETGTSAGGRGVGQVQGNQNNLISPRHSNFPTLHCSPEKARYLHLKEHLSNGTSNDQSSDDVISSLILAGDIAFECERLLKIASTHKEPLILGLDLDWPSTYTAFLVKTANIHLCYGENTCLLFDVVNIKKLPIALIQLIKHSNVRLIGHNIIEDLLKLGKDFNVDVKEVIKSNLILSSSVGSKLSCRHHWSFSEEDPLHRIVQEDEIEEGSGESSSEAVIPIVQTRLPAQFSGVIKFSTSFNECAAYSEELLVRADHSDLLVLGFDLEWPFSYTRGSGKVALIQICPDEGTCYIFHVFHLTSLPKALVLLLKHSNVRLTGLNIANDVRKLWRDFNLDLSEVLNYRLIELSSFANEKLRCHHRWSLAGLVSNQLKLDLDKGPVRVSDWSKKRLTQQQLLYAATDAYVSLLCYKKLMNVER